MYMAKNINYKLIIKAFPGVLRSRATQSVLSQCRNDYMYLRKLQKRSKLCMLKLKTKLYRCLKVSIELASYL